MPSVVIWVQLLSSLMRKPRCFRYQMAKPRSSEGMSTMVSSWRSERLHRLLVSTHSANAAGSEFGLELLAKILKDNADKPLRAIMELVLAQADAFGNQDDDQTLLLVRVRA